MLDLYVGPLCTYYERSWKTQAQKASEAAGIPHVEVRMARPLTEAMSPGDLKKVTAEWTQSTCSSLSEHLKTEISWLDDEAIPYFTMQMPFDCLGALKLTALEQERQGLVEMIPALAGATDEELLEVLKDEGIESNFKNLLREPSIWLPCSLPFTYTGEDVPYNMIMIGSSFSLFDELLLLNSCVWNASEDELIEWWQAGTPASDASVDDKNKYAISGLTYCAKYSMAHQVPMVAHF